jgi:hypothetical protein
MEELLAAKERLVAAGIDVIGPVNHTIFKSIYFFDPNGHRLELACNTGTPEMMRSWTTSNGRCWKNGRRLKKAPSHAAWMHAEGERMKLATLKDGSRDGRLVVVSRDLSRYQHVPKISATLQHALDNWDLVAPRLEQVYRAERRRCGRCPAFRPAVLPLAAAARLSVGRRFGLHQPRGAGAQGAQRRSAGLVLHRSADVSGRFGQLRRPA